MTRLTRNVRALFIALCTTALLAACSSGPTVRTDTDPDANFGQYKTWGFYSPLSMEKSGYSTWVSERIKTNIRREMTARGYAYSEKPDLWVNFRERRDVRTAVYPMTQTDVRYFYNPRARAYIAVPVYYDDYAVHQYVEGTLSVDIVDSKANRMVWTADAVGRSMQKLPAKRAPEIDTALTAIFMHYPYTAGNAQPVGPAK